MISISIASEHVDNGLVKNQYLQVIIEGSPCSDIIHNLTEAILHRESKITMI